MKVLTLQDKISHQWGKTMTASVGAGAIPDAMSRHDHTTVTYMPAMIRIDGDGKMEFKMDEISEELGRVMTPHIFEISTSTHYGRVVMIDDNTVALFGAMNDALAYA